MRDGGILNDVAFSQGKDGRIGVGAIHKPPENVLPKFALYLPGVMYYNMSKV